MVEHEERKESGMTEEERAETEPETSQDDEEVGDSPSISRAEALLDLGQGLQIWKVHVDELHEQPINARGMPKAMMDRLTSTIGRDQRLESLPFVALTDGRLEIVSGHHRVRSARAGQLSEIFAIVDVSGLTPDQIRAKQLSHNAIQGEDNPQLIAKIYEAIGDVSARLETFIDPKSLEMDFEKVTIPNIDIHPDFRTALIVFLPYDFDRFERAVEKVIVQLSADHDVAYLADIELLERWKAVLRKVGIEYEIRSTGTVLSRMADIVLEHLGENLPEGELTPLRDVVGTASIPAPAAKVISDALDRMVALDEVSAKARWQGLEYLAAEYLGSA